MGKLIERIEETNKNRKVTEVASRNVNSAKENPAKVVDLEQ